MSKKPNTVSKTVTKRDCKNALDTCQQSLTKQRESSSHAVTEETPEKLASYENCSTLIEVTVKTKGHKHMSTMVSSSPRTNKSTEEKKKAVSSTDVHHNWGQVLREENRTAIKQSLQGVAVKQQGLKMSRQKPETKDSKEIKKQKEHKTCEISSKLTSASQKRSESHTKPTSHNMEPSSTTNNIESILVVDRGVQCDGIFDYLDNKFNGVSPIRTLAFLIKELKHSAKSDKGSKILTQMEHILCKIPGEFQKSSMQDLESVTLRSKLERCTIQLEETSKEMNAMCESLREERNALQRQVHKQVLLLNEARQRELELSETIKKVQAEAEELKKTVQSKEKLINNLKEEIRGYEYSQKVSEDLRANLNEQSQLARQRDLEVQYLTLEKEKLSVLSSYKDTLLIDLRKSIKDLQSSISGQLAGLKNICTHETTSNPQMSLIEGGVACSSPTPTSDRESDLRMSWHEVSDVSAVEPDSQKDNEVDQFLPGPNKIGQSRGKADSIKKKGNKNSAQSKARDSIQLEFISLPGGESSNIAFPFYRDASEAESSHAASKGREDCAVSNGKNSNIRNSDGVKMPLNPLDNASSKIDTSDIPAKRSSNKQKSPPPSDTRSNDKKGNNSEDRSQILKDNLPPNFMGSSITRQFQNIFDGIRVQSRMPIELPSPPRNYPPPDISQTTLPSISAISDLNGIQSNGT